jgi:hypothetical protein
MSRLEKALELLVAAVAHAVAEHGVPNRFSPTELHEFYHGPHPVTIGRIARRDLAALNRKLAAIGELVVVSYERPATLSGNVYQPAMLRVEAL